MMNKEYVPKFWKFMTSQDEGSSRPWKYNNSVIVKSFLSMVMDFEVWDMGAEMLKSETISDIWYLYSTEW